MDEMKNLYMDKKIEDKIKQLDSYYSELFKHFEQIKSLMDSLQGEWESQTSAVVFENFQHANQQFQKIKATCSNVYKFLNNAYEDYVEYEKSNGATVDEYIATSDKNFFTEQDKKATVDYTSKLDNTVVTVKSGN